MMENDMNTRLITKMSIVKILPTRVMAFEPREQRNGTQDRANQPGTGRQASKEAVKPVRRQGSSQETVYERNASIIARKMKSQRNESKFGALGGLGKGRAPASAWCVSATESRL